MANHHNKLTVCPNCGTKLSPEDNFCPNCGQENHEVKLPLGHILYEFVESITHFDNKLWNTLKAIFTRPGKMTAEFLEGKRMRYVPPARLYVFVSVIFFFLVGKFADYQLKQSLEGYKKVAGDSLNTSLKIDLDGLVNNDSLLKATHLRSLANDVTVSTPLNQTALENKVRQLKQATQTELDSLLSAASVSVTDTNRAKLRQLISLIPEKPTIEWSSGFNFSKKKFDNEQERREYDESLETMPEAQLDSLIRSEGETPSWFTRNFHRRQGKLNQLTKEENAHQLLHAVTKNFSVVMFILMPFVAVLLLFFYFRRGRYYYEHLIFSVHIHTVLFLLFSIALLTTFFASPDVTSSVLKWTIWVGWAYFFLSLKRVYGQSWAKTTVKFLFLSFMYSLIATVFLVVAAFAGLLTF
jgi:hypothetical protein